MSAFLATLLGASAALLLVVLLLRLPRYRDYAAATWLALALGAGQVALGALWVLWGVLFLHGRGSGSFAGWSVVVLGGLWTLQGARRLARRSRSPR
jgi:heme A synthase